MPKPSLFKKPIETGHTVASINIVRKQLLRLLRIVNIVVQALVLPYYAYLLGKNWGDAFYVTVYSILIGVSLSAVIIEQVIINQQNKAEGKAEKRRIKKRRRVNNLIFKSIKYVIRLLILIMAYVQIALGVRNALFVATTILSTLLILGQILLDILVMLILRYFEYIRLGFEADLKSSPIFNMGSSDAVTARRLESQAEEMGVLDVSSSEVSKLDEIKAEMALNQEEAKKEAQASIRHSSILIRQKKFDDAVADPSIQEKIEKKFKKKLVDAKGLLTSPIKYSLFLSKMRKKLEKAPEGLRGLDAFPLMLDWVEDKESGISESAKSSILAACLYCLDPFTVIPSYKGEISFADDEYVINKVIDEVEAEYQAYSAGK